MKKTILLLLLLGFAACTPPTGIPPAEIQAPTRPDPTLTGTSPAPPPATPQPRKDPQPVATPQDQVQTPNPASLPLAALAAQKTLAAKLKISAADVSITSSEEMEWPDGCLGAAAPGEMCLMVITPGYRVTLEAQGKAYQAHTDQSGKIVRILP